MTEALPPEKPPRLQWSIRLSALSLLSLLLLFSWRNLSGEDGSWLRWLIQCLPLAMFIPGMLVAWPRTYSWLCFVVLLYLIPAMTQVVMGIGYRGAESPPGQLGDWVSLVLLLVLFFTAAFNSRWLQHWHLQSPSRR